MNTSPDLTTIVPLKHVNLEPEEKQLCSVILNQVKQQKMFLIGGPATYAFNNIRYYGHLTNRRLILEVYPLSNLEKVAMKATIALGKMLAPGTARAAKIHMNTAKKVMSDPEGNWVSLPYKFVTVEIVKSLGIAKFIHLRMPTKDVDLYFQVGSAKSKTIITNRNFIDDFVVLIQGLITDSK